MKGNIIRHKEMLEIGENVVGLYELQYPGDLRPRKAIEMKRLWLQGAAKDEELFSATIAARVAVRAAAEKGLGGAAHNAAIAAVRAATWDTTWEVSMAAERAKILR